MIRSYLVIFVPVFAAGVFTGWVIPWCWRQWWQASSVIAAETAHAAADLPVPYWPADPIDLLATAVQCTWCKPKPNGMCTCSARCGHLRCIGGRSLFTVKDREILEGKRPL